MHEPSDTVRPPPAAPQAMNTEKMEYLLEAIRTGRLRVADEIPKSAVFCPRMEVYDDPTSERVVATFEIPGVKISELSISVKQGMLVIRGRRRCRYNPSGSRSGNRGGQHPSSVRGLADSAPASEPSTDHGNRFFPYRELRYGCFHRRVRLSPGADTARITATLADGLLTVTWPRTQVVQSGSEMNDMRSNEGSVDLVHTTSYVRSDPPCDSSNVQH